MPISKDFLPLFKDFVTNYKIKGTPAFYNWAKEQNHLQISQFFDELLTLINSNQESFHDASIIDHLNVTVLLSANTNRYLLECWIDFLTKYNVATQSYAPISSMDSKTSVHIQVGPEGTTSERMLIDLKKALEVTQHAFALAQQAHSTEIELLKRQIAALKSHNAMLSAENHQLKDQVRDEQIFKALHPQITSAQEQLSSFAELLKTLNEVTGKSPDSTPQPQPPIPFSPENTESTTSLPSTAVVTITTEPVPTNTPSAVGVTPPPPPPPSLSSPAFGASTTIKASTTASSSFFPKKEGTLFDELAAVLKEREAKGTANLSAVEEKKNR